MSFKLRGIFMLPGSQSSQNKHLYLPQVQTEHYIHRLKIWKCDFPYTDALAFSRTSEVWKQKIFGFRQSNLF